MAKPTVEDKAKSIGENIFGGIPLVGSIYNGYKMVEDVSNIQRSEGEAQKQANRDLAGHALGFVPLLGTAMGVAGLGYDILEDDDTSENLLNRMLGGEDKYPSTQQSDYIPGPDAMTPAPLAPYADDPDMILPSPQVCE